MLPWFPADVGEGAHTTTEQLVPPPGADDLKVQRLVKLTQVIRCETKTESHLTLRLHGPPEDGQPKRWVEQANGLTSMIPLYDVDFL